MLFASVSLHLLHLCYTSNLSLDAVTVNFMRFIIIRSHSFFQLMQSLCSHPPFPFTLCNHCRYCTDVCVCRHVGFMMRCGWARGSLKGGENSCLTDIKTGLNSERQCVSLIKMLHCQLTTFPHTHGFKTHLSR